MDEVRFNKIYEQAATENGVSSDHIDASDFEIVVYLLKQLNRGKIKDPILEGLLMQRKAYEIIFYIEVEIDGINKEGQDNTDLEPPF